MRILVTAALSGLAAVALLARPAPASPAAKAPPASPRVPSRAFFRRSRHLCETVWPRARRPSRALSLRCVRYWTLAHGYGLAGGEDRSVAEILRDDSNNDGDIAVKYLASDFEHMAVLARRACAGVKPAAPDGLSKICFRALEFFPGAARSHFTLSAGGAWNDRADPLYRVVLSGAPLYNVPGPAGSNRPCVVAGTRPPCDAPLRSPYAMTTIPGVTLWKLRNAIYARHGRHFKNPDLERFFWGDRGLPDEQVDFLPVRTRQVYRAGSLTYIDRVNLALIRRAERGLLHAPPD